MIKFLIKGILRDPSKSIIPIFVITIGVLVTVVVSGMVKGMLSDVVNKNANLDTGHLKIMTKPYAENKDQLPNDLAILDLSILKDSLELNYPNVDWAPRIKFGGIIDVPDEEGETKIQGPTLGLAYSIIDKESNELKRLGVNKLELINKDTFTGVNSYFSARRSLKKRENDYGRNISLIMIN